MSAFLTLPLTLPLAAMADRRLSLSCRPDWTPDTTCTTPVIRVLQIELMDDAEEAALRAHFPGLTYADSIQGGGA